MVIPRGRDGARSGRAGYLPEIPSPRRSPFAYYLYKLRAYFISLTRDHNGRHRSVFSHHHPLLPPRFLPSIRLSATGFAARLSDIDTEARHRDPTKRPPVAGCVRSLRSSHNSHRVSVPRTGVDAAEPHARFTAMRYFLRVFLPSIRLSATRFADIEGDRH